MIAQPCNFDKKNITVKNRMNRLKIYLLNKFSPCDGCPRDKEAVILYNTSTNPYVIYIFLYLNFGSNILSDVS